MMIFRRLLCISSTLVLASCAGPRPEVPPQTAVQPPADWRTPHPGGVAIEADWWRAFGDPVLARLVEQALADNPDIGQAAARVMVARGQAGAALAELGPEFDLTGSGTFTRTRAAGQTVDLRTRQFGVGATWDADLFGQLRNLSRAARASLLASAASRDAVALSTASTTASSYITLLGLDAQMAIARDTLASTAESLQVARRLASTGYTSQLELHQAESQYQTTESLIPQVQLAVSKQENVISVLLGSNPGEVARGGLLGAIRAPAIPAGLPSDLMRRRPDIYAAEETVVAADRSLDAARAAMLPQLSLTASLGRTFMSTGPSPATLFTAGANVLAPLFDSGRRRAQIDVQAGLRNEAAYAYRGIALRAFSDVENALVSIQRLDERRQALGREVETDRVVLRIARDRYRAGYSAYTDQLDAQRLLLSAQLSQAQTQTDWLNAHVALYQAMGGGWPQPTGSSTSWIGDSAEKPPAGRSKRE